MNPEKAFKAGYKDPETGFTTKEWYGCASDFIPETIVHQGDKLLGVRRITALDVASKYGLCFDIIPTPPATLTNVRFIPFLDMLIKRHGKPLKGIVISHSCWLSSVELTHDVDTAVHGRFLKSIGAQFKAMPETDKNELLEWGRKHEVRVIFYAEQMFQYQ